MYGSRSLVAELSAVDGESVGRHVSNIGCQRVSDIVRHNEKRRYLKLSERNNVALHTQWQAEERSRSSMDFRATLECNASY